MSFYRQTHSHRSNGQRRIVGRGQGQEQPVQLFALRASPRLDKKGRRSRSIIGLGSAQPLVRLPERLVENDSIAVTAFN